MKNSTTFIANISKYIGSFLILAFAFITFAHGQGTWCTTPRWIGLTNWTSIPAYSYTEVEFPKTCNQFKTTLFCNNGILEWNRQTYQYSGCVTTWLPVPGVDLTLTQTPVRNNYKVAQGSSPEINIVFYNNGTSGVNKIDVPEGFLSCDRVGDDFTINIYTSRTLSSFSVASATKVGVNIRFKTIFTQALGTKGVICTLNPDILWVTDENSWNNIRTGIFEVVEADRFDLALSESIDPIRQNLEAAEGAVGTQWLQNFLFDKIMNVLVPLVIIIGILSAILGFYKLMFSSDENATKEGTRYIIYGIIGIIIIMSAKFIWSQVYNILNPVAWEEIVGTNIAQMLYNNILYPFIKLAIYLVLGAMFVILVGRVITFLFGNDADAQKKAGTLIGWNVISMFVIIGAKQIVEAIYGKQEDVIKEITNLGEVGSGILADKNIPIIRQVINYALGIASLVILVIIIIQTVKLLTKPDDPAQIKNIKNSLLYMFIGILVLGAGYLIVNFAIIN